MNTRLWIDLFRLALGAVTSHRLRSGLTMLGIIIGVASVILLTSLGEGTRVYILQEFGQFGTNLLTVSPGRVTTSGMPSGIGATVRKLTIDDAQALLRVPGIERVIPLDVGVARVTAGERGRSVFIYGVTSDVPYVWKFQIRQGRFLPEGDPRQALPLVVLGPKLKHELFGDESALGQRVHIGGRRFLVIGVMAPKGQVLGFDVDDAAYMGVASAQDLFNHGAVARFDVLFSERVAVRQVQDGIREALMRRHDGEEDFTITTQTDMLDSLDRILGVINLAVAAIAGISLIVGAIGILTIMWITVGERTSEIGLVMAIGALPRQLLGMFLIEAALLSVAGGLVGVAAGLGIAALLRWIIPGLPLETPMMFIGLALLVSLGVGLLAGVLPARRAARLDPVEALHAE
jgi:putative ABC transport system permease protein